MESKDPREPLLNAVNIAWSPGLKLYCAVELVNGRTRDRKVAEEHRAEMRRILRLVSSAQNVRVVSIYDEDNPDTDIPQQTLFAILTSAETEGVFILEDEGRKFTYLP